MAKNKVIKEQNLYKILLERYEEMSDYLSELIDDNKRNVSELRYLEHFIHYKNLDDEFRYFKEHANEEHDEDLPFLYLTL